MDIIQIMLIKRDTGTFMITEKQFVEDNKKEWDELDKLIRKKRKSYEEMNRVMTLYHRTTEDLSYAQTNFSNSNTVLYINRIVQQCHLFFYRPKQPRLKRLIIFIIKGFAQKITALKYPILLSAAIFLSATLFSFFLIKNNTDLSEIFLDARTYEMVQEDLEMQKKFSNFDNISEEVRVPISLYLWYHNSRVALTAFALGITFGVGTFYILLMNGFMLGSLAAIYFINGNFADFTSLILIHGSIELTAIMIAGGLGFHIAGALLLPSRQKRIYRLKQSSLTALKCLFGVFMLLLWAGLEEGLITPLKLPIGLRFSIAGLNSVLLILYISIGAMLKRKDRNLPPLS